MGILCYNEVSNKHNQHGGFMRIIQLLTLIFILAVQPSFADDTMTVDSKPCSAIVKACGQAGFIHNESNGKKFWFDCMKPVLLGQAVKGVTIDAMTVKSCRADKINKLKQEMTELENVR